VMRKRSRRYGNPIPNAVMPVIKAHFPASNKAYEQVAGLSLIRF
jgi:hypothetical protein